MISVLILAGMTCEMCYIDPRSIPSQTFEAELGAEKARAAAAAAENERCGESPY